MQELWNQGRASPCEEAQSHGKRLSCKARVETLVQRGGMHGFSHHGFAGFGSGTSLVTALRPSRIKSLTSATLFAVIDAIQSEEVPTLHHQSLMPLNLLVSNCFSISQLPLLYRASSLTERKG